MSDLEVGVSDVGSECLMYVFFQDCYRWDVKIGESDLRIGESDQCRKFPTASFFSGAIYTPCPPSERGVVAFVASCVCEGVELGVPLLSALLSFPK